MSSAYRQVVSLAVAGAVVASTLTGGAALARSLKDNKPHDGVTRAHTMPIQGIDVSYWQGDIDWQKVRGAGISFAYIKATEGGDHLDPKFRQNWYASKRAGTSSIGAGRRPNRPRGSSGTFRTIPTPCRRSSISNGIPILRHARSASPAASLWRRSR